MQFLFVSFRRRKTKFSLNLFFVFFKKRQKELGSVYCWSIHLLYLHPAQENHTALFTILCILNKMQKNVVCSSLAH